MFLWHAMFEFSQKQWVRFDSQKRVPFSAKCFKWLHVSQNFQFQKENQKLNSEKLTALRWSCVSWLWCPLPSQLSHHGKMCEVAADFHFACITFWCNINNFRISFIYFFLAVSLSISPTQYLLFFRRHFYLFLLLLCRCRQ